MSYRTFSTDNAEYTLVHAIHIIVTDEDILRRPKNKDLDAIVLENSGYDANLILNHQQYTKIFSEIESSEKEIKVYMADVAITKKGLSASGTADCIREFAGIACLVSMPLSMNRRQFLKRSIAALCGLGVLIGDFSPGYYGSKEGKVSPILPTLTSASSYILPTPVTELRNAIAARKTEEFIAPKLRKELGKKPSICLVYGAGHAGIELDLKNKTLRDAVLAAYKKIDYAGINKGMLEVVQELRFVRSYSILGTTTGRWLTKIYKTELFT